MEKIKRQLYKRRGEITFYAAIWGAMAVLGMGIDLLFTVIEPVGDPPVGSFAGMLSLIASGLAILSLGVFMFAQNFNTMISFGVTRKKFIIGEVISSIVGTLIMLMLSFGLLFVEGNISQKILGERFTMDSDVSWILNHKFLIIMVAVLLAVFIRVAIGALIIRLTARANWLYLLFYVAMITIARFGDQIISYVNNVNYGLTVLLVGAGIIWGVGIILGVFSIKKQGIS